MASTLPPNANLRQLRHRAKDLLRARRGPGFSLKDAQTAIAAEYGFDDWRALKATVETQDR